MELNIHGYIWLAIWSTILSIPVHASDLTQNSKSKNNDNPSSPSLVHGEVDLFNLPQGENEIIKSLVASVSCSTCNDELIRDGEKYGRGVCCIYASFSRCLITNTCHSLDTLGIEYAINHTANKYGCKDGPIRFISFNCLMLYYWLPVVIVGLFFLAFAAMLCVQMAMRKPTW